MLRARPRPLKGLKLEIDEVVSRLGIVDSDSDEFLLRSGISDIKGKQQ